ncbi:low molecular weight protein-tyrosine-phosphatase [Xanthovirga aplysinae]|uniref:low molecular weight protein-tyrosine-phosphatase n=1 Tax=Xanthovirga aplysinae TaxID=2529853 RepID=UPI0012BC5957|nr:low molecular weight protein-tyrosine-phosphatase [Xanthovirga aplysinae]MTI30389.1 low molecular weight phosphotyrosine protein phosphatase [Xanthovirga aplysinae]
MQSKKSHLNKRPIKVMFVCLGNICRSPLAEAIFKKQIQQADLMDSVFCDSSGVSSYHVGSGPDKRSAANARNHGIEIVHKARQFTIQDFKEFDQIIAMDSSNFEHIVSMENKDQEFKLFRMREFDPKSNGKLDVPDPYFGGEGGFEEVFQILDRSLSNYLDYLIEEYHLK